MTRADSSLKNKTRLFFTEALTDMFNVMALNIKNIIKKKNPMY